jgi:hypothetical protein
MASRGLLRCSSGGIAIEIALIIPVIMFLLYATVDLFRLHQLSSRVGQAAELIADHFSQEEILTDQMIIDALGVSRKISSEHFYGGEPSLTITAIRIHSENDQKLLWTRQSLVSAEPCQTEIYEIAAPKLEIKMPAVIQFFYQVDLCVEVDSSFIISGLIKLVPRIRRTAMALARSPAVRQFD